MDSLNPNSKSRSLLDKRQLEVSSSPSTNFLSSFASETVSFLSTVPRIANMQTLKAIIVSAINAEKPQNKYPGEAKGFIEEMRFVAMKFHTREQAKEGEKEVEKREEKSVSKWEPSLDGYLRFLADSKLVYDTLDCSSGCFCFL